MKDLAAELRKLDWLRDEYRETGDLIFEAADEIERLREDNAALKAALRRLANDMQSTAIELAGSDE